MVLMGAVGVPFDIAHVDAVWGYEPSVENMRAIMEFFAYDKSLLGDDLAALRYQASIRPGVQEAFHAMFPGHGKPHLTPCACRRIGEKIAAPTLLVHGRDDR